MKRRHFLWTTLLTPFVGFFARPEPTFTTEAGPSYITKEAANRLADQLRGSPEFTGAHCSILIIDDLEHPGPYPARSDDAPGWFTETSPED